jgi:peroxiredoxin
MKEMIKTLIQAPDFSLVDTQGREVRLSNFAGKQNVVLVFNRGFA